MTGNQAWGEGRLGTQALIRVLRRLNAINADGPRAK
jgi:hypothetical protein